jgi:prepilin signal peptidase PulO-like enzyme (type II secretory pathway)
MNPLTWQREHQMALLLGTVLGILAGLLVGYIQHDIHLATLQQWMSGWSSIRWAVLGALFGAGLIYVHRLLRA